MMFGSLLCPFPKKQTNQRKKETERSGIWMSRHTRSRWITYLSHFSFLKPGFHVIASIAQITQNRAQAICVILWNFADDWGDHSNHYCLDRTMFHQGNNDHDNCSTSEQTYNIFFIFWENRLHFYSGYMWSDQKHSITSCRATVTIIRNS